EPYERVTGVDRVAEVVRDRDRQLLVAAADVIALVGHAEDAEALLRLVAEQVDEVQRRLDPGVGAVLDRVRDIEARTERRAVAAGDARLDPVVDARVIELLTVGGRGVV